MSDTTEVREFDALIAEKVMGWKVQPIRVIGFGGSRPDFGTVKPSGRMIDGRDGVEATRVPAYSTSIAAAWLVKERVREMMGVNAPLWDARIAPALAMPAAKAAEFICRAALTAVEEA